MTYNIDTLPAQLYFKILEENNPDLLTDDKEVDAFKLWDNIYNSVSKLSNNKSKNKFFDIAKSIQHISTKIEVVSNAVFYLQRKRDPELEELLKSYNYKLSEVSFYDDLEQIKKQINNLEIKIARHKKELEKLNIEPKEKQTFEDVYFSYCAILYPYKEMGTILIKEFISFEKQVINKIKNIEKNGK